MSACGFRPEASCTRSKHADVTGAIALPERRCAHAALSGVNGFLARKMRAEGAGWREIARMVLRLDREYECYRVRKAFDSHLSRAKWMTEHGYRHLLRGGASA